MTSQLLTAAPPCSSLPESLVISLLARRTSSVLVLPTFLTACRAPERQSAHAAASVLVETSTCPPCPAAMIRAAWFTAGPK